MPLPLCVYNYNSICICVLLLWLHTSEGKQSVFCKFEISRNRSVGGSSYGTVTADVTRNSCPLCSCSKLCARDERCGAVTVSDPDTADGQLTNCLFYNVTIKDTDFSDGNATLLLKKNVIRDCHDVMLAGQTTSGVSTIYPEPGDDSVPHEVFCDMSTAGGGWTVLLRRQNGSLNFDREWDAYKDGFGDMSNEFWAGNEFMHVMTSSPRSRYRVHVDLISFAGEYRYAEYETFVVDDEANKYKLHIGIYSGNATDAFSSHDGLPFSTKDQDRDTATYNCAERFEGGFWYHDCSNARLTGFYGRNVSNAIVNGQDYFRGILWSTWLGYEEHPQFVEMKIKPLE